MILKFVFKNEIHRCSKVPGDFLSLLDTLKQVFKDNLPEFFTLQYDDADGDKIMLTSNEDYKTMLESDMKSSQASVKVYITPSEKNISLGSLSVKKEEKESKPKVDEKPIEKPVIKEEKPVIEEKIPIVVEIKDPLEKAVNEADEAVKKFNIEPELEAKVHALVLKTLRNQLDLVAGAVRQNIVKSQETIKPTTPESLFEALVYVQKLAQGVEGASTEQILSINKALKDAIDNCKVIQDKRILEKKEQEQPRKEPVEEKKIVEPIKQMPSEVKPVEVVEAFNGEFVKEVSQLPNELTVKDINLYKTIVVKNTGKETYPVKTVLECVNSKENSTISVPQIQPGKEFTTVLIITSPGKPGKYTSTWAFRTTTSNGAVQEFGKRFDVHFEIIGDKKPEEKPKTEEKPKPEVTYSTEIKEKARQIKEVFPQYNIDDICEYISKSPSKTVDELFNEYMSLHNSINT